MSEAFRSSAALRHDFCETIVDLRQRYTAPLPDNATVFVGGANALYRLNKNLGDTFDDLTGQIVVPANDSLDRWVQEEVLGASPWFGIEYSAAAVLVTPSAQFQWTALGSTAGSFALSSGDAAMFAVNPTNSLLTYHGPQRYMLITSLVNVLNAGDTASIYVRAVVSHNNDVPAGTTLDHRAEGEQQARISDNVVSIITTQRSVLLADGDTLRCMLRNINGAQVLEVPFFSLTVQPR